MRASKKFMVFSKETRNHLQSIFDTVGFFLVFTNYKNKKKIGSLPHEKFT